MKVAALAAFLTIACSVAASAQDKLSVVTTTAQIADVARAIGGEWVEVTSLMGEGVDPHTYRQTRRDIVLLKQADLIVANGLYLEAQLEPILETLASAKPVYSLGESLPKDKLLAHAEYTGKFDPHIWMDVQLWAEAATHLRNEMAMLWPEHESAFADNLEPYLTDLAALNSYVSQSISTIPESERLLITAHDAFNYFSRAYDIQVEGIQGLSTESEAGIKRIEDLVTLIVDRGINAVFVESSVADRNVKALIEGSAARGHEIVIGGSLFSDAMGAPGTYEGSYLGMLDHNATTITRALGGIAPEFGMKGLLAAGS